MKKIIGDIFDVALILGIVLFFLFAKIWKKRADVVAGGKICSLAFVFDLSVDVYLAVSGEAAQESG